jgi:hypothetical protein
MKFDGYPGMVIVRGGRERWGMPEMRLGGGEHTRELKMFIIYEYRCTYILKCYQVGPFMKKRN